MKKLLQIPLLLVALFLTTLPITTYGFEVDGIYYRITDETAKTVEVTYKSSYFYGDYSGTISIPNSVCYNNSTYTVTAIGSAAFRNCTNLTTLIIEDGTQPLSLGENRYVSYGTGEGLFYDCPLDSVYIGRNITFSNRKFDGYSPFYNSNTIKSVTIGESVTKIDNQTFLGCSGLKNLIFEDGIQTLSLGYNSYSSLTVGVGATDGSGLFSSCPLETIHLGRNISYASGAEYGYSPFAGKSRLKSVTIGKSVSYIGEYAFKGCWWLTSFYIPNSVTEIRKGAFNGCSGLTNLTIEDGTDTLTLGYNTYSYSSHKPGEGLFYDCHIDSLYLGRNLSYDTEQCYGYSPFYNIGELKSVTIGKFVSSIGDYAFYGCNELTSIAIPNSVTKIGQYAFEDTKWYNNQPDGMLYINNVLYKYKGIMPNNTSVVIKDGTVCISVYAFSDCSGLTSITIPSSVTEIENCAFSGCDGLSSIIIENGAELLLMGYNNYNSSYNRRGEGLFYDCPIDSLYLGRNISYNEEQSYGYSPFANKYGLETVTIGNSVTKIADYTFYSCFKIDSITIPNSVTSIGDYAFDGCTGLTSVTIGNLAAEIGDYAFARCFNLKCLNIPSSVASIATNAFMECGKLVNINFDKTQTTITLTKLSTPTQYAPYVYFNSDYLSIGDKFTNLTPGSNHNYQYGLIINGTYCYINGFSISTLPFNVTLTGTIGVTTLSANGTYTQGDATFVSQGINIGSKVTNFDNKNNVTFENLDPNTLYTVYYGVKIKESTSTYTTSETFTTEALNWVNGRYDATSTTSARLIVETNCDATLGTGYEWRRIDAPDIIASSKVECPVVNGMLVGSLRNLNPDVYYKCRPYYTSASGNTYYGDWVGFYTADANVYFSPEVLTYSNVAVNNNSAVVKGYALEGTDVITAQGFEYWKTGTTIKPASTDDRKVVNASGIAMSATLTNLDYNSTYKYRAFVTTEKGTVYGDEIEFSTGDDPAGIGYIEIDNDELTVTLRENPATGTAWVKIAGATGGEAQYAITSMSGSMVACGRVMLEDEWNAIELDCPSGLYLLTINDGKQVKTLRLIVK